MLLGTTVTFEDNFSKILSYQDDFGAVLSGHSSTRCRSTTIALSNHIAGGAAWDFKSQRRMPTKSCFPEHNKSKQQEETQHSTIFKEDLKRNPN
ncbi:hypothetical protein Y1Q_0015865 [Alligator mississippiensis]|uniref:Uncharacterized protein n=1 Tax=Alligator mississippiensis TaxID=8496 RepID=A0A151MHK4_ALLMI|nr:hypothetical protein Y1Q_0015865 [Alligator mississippiensis]